MEYSGGEDNKEVQMNMNDSSALPLKSYISYDCLTINRLMAQNHVL